MEYIMFKNPPILVVGQMVRIIGNSHGVNAMDLFVNDGNEYMINKADIANNEYIVTGWYWKGEDLEPVSSLNSRVIIGTAAPKPIPNPMDSILNEPEEISEEEDPYGLIAQRKALREFIGG
jgi:hypothetical protein